MADSNNWHLGETSEHYESGSRGAGTISSGHGDYGGVSYGSYQLSTNAGTLKEYLNQSTYKNQFNGLNPATPEFNAKWTMLAKTDPGFAEDQHNFIKTSHYDIQVGRLKSDGLDLTDRGPAVQDALWSTSVQYRDLTKGIFEKGLEEKFGKDYKISQLSDKNIVEAVQDYKIQHTETLFSKSPKLWDSLEDRAKNEKADLLKLADQEKTVGHTHGLRSHEATSANSKDSHPHLALNQGGHGAEVRILQQNLNKLGYTDASGQALKADGNFGENTKHAVEAFQRDHHLTVDGIAGPKTLDAIHNQTQANKVSGLDSPANPNHALYLQAQKAVHELDARQGRTPDQQSNNLAAALTVATKHEGLTRIDQVALSDDGSRAFAVQNGAFKQTAQVQTAEAVHTSIAQSSQALQQAAPAQPSPTHVQHQSQAPQQASPGVNV